MGLLKIVRSLAPVVLSSSITCHTPKKYDAHPMQNWAVQESRDYTHPTIDLGECKLEKTPKLETRIQSTIDKLRKNQKLFSDEEIFFIAYDHNNNEVLAENNANEPMQLASMVKVLVAIAYLTKEDEGTLKNPNKNSDRYALGDMILNSNNRATNTLITKIGGPEEVQNIVKEYGIDSEIVEYIPTRKAIRGRTYQNKASPKEMLHALDVIRKGNVPNADLLWELMYHSKRKRLSPPENKSEPNPTEQIYSKTGSTGMLIADMGTITYQDQTGTFQNVSIVIGIEREIRTPDRWYRQWKKERGEIVRSLSRTIVEYQP